MDHEKHDQHWLGFLPKILPAIYILLCAVTAISGEKSATGGNPFVGVSFPISWPLVARDDTLTVIAVAILATVWWFFVGQIGWSSKQGHISGSRSGLGAILIGFIVGLDLVFMSGEFPLILREPNFNAVDVVIYLLAALLLAGGIISAAYSLRAAIAPHKHS